MYKTEGGFVLATLSKSQLSVIFLFFNINLFQLEVNYFTILYWFCHTSTWIHHRYTHVPHPEPSPSSLPIPSLWVISVHQPQVSSIMHRTWTGNLFHIWYFTCFNAILPKTVVSRPTTSASSRYLLKCTFSNFTPYLDSEPLGMSLEIWALTNPQEILMCP